MRTAVVTGGGRRIGLTICRRLLDAGWRVVATSFAPSPELDALHEKEAGRLVTVPADLATPRGAAQAAADIAGQAPAIDLLVLNAGILEPEAMAAIDPDAALRQFAVNALAPAVLVDRLRANLSPSGSIVAITDACLAAPTPDNAGYAMSKAALDSLVDLWALALAPVRANAVAPAYAAPYPGESEAQRQARARETLLLGHAPAMTEVADAVLYLADARSVTGCRLAVDAGLGLRPPSRDFTMMDSSLA